MHATRAQTKAMEEKSQVEDKKVVREGKIAHDLDVVSITSQDSMSVQSTPDSDSIALCNMTDDELVKNCTRIVVPKGKREDILMAGHNNPLAGHLGLKKTESKLACHFTWPGVVKDVSKWVKSCP